ncbi:amidase [Fictibacillus nanhaiensis]|uniref:amidase n=1 Tax=Fictibacillus nanhaiensis TaxID=742169 RepID=UPI003C1421C5
MLPEARLILWTFNKGDTSMKNKGFICLFVIVSLVISMASPIYATDKRRLQTNKTFATYLWHTNKIVTDKKDILNFLQSKGVNTLYLQIDPNIQMSKYQQFIKDALKIGVRVHALDVAPDWIEPNHKGPEQFMNWLANYQLKASNSEKFSGIHLDVEPYTLTEWDTNHEEIVNRYQDLLINTKLFANQIKLPLYADIPFWFDEHFYSNNRFGKCSLSEWVIRNTDGISIMANRNFTDGQNGILALTASEVRYAKKMNKRVVIAIETDQIDDAPYLSFSHLTQQDMYHTLTKVNDHYYKEKSFDGFAIHHYSSWKQLTD